MDDRISIQVSEGALMGEVCRGLALSLLEWTFGASAVQRAGICTAIAEAVEHLAGGGAAAGAVADLRRALLGVADPDDVADFLTFARLIVDGGDDDHALRPRLLHHLRRLNGWMEDGR